MRFTAFLTAAAAIAGAEAALKGYNYGSTKSDGSFNVQSDFHALFSTAMNLEGTSGFASARLYTMIQGGTADTVTSAIPAAISTQTMLLLGLWASAGQASFSNELTALSNAITQYGSSLTDLIVGISVGSEDLYRVSPTGILNLSGAGASPDELVSYIGQVRSTISGTTASGASVGHVDTWTAWVNGSNDAVISACDWLGMDAYPYFENTLANSIGTSNSTFYDALDATRGAADGKAVWVTETGWPVSGPTENQAVAFIQNAQTYWDEVGCSLFASGVNTWWYTLQDAAPNNPGPSFGIVGSTLSTTPLLDLTCPADSGNAGASSSASSSAASTAASSVASATAPTTTASASSVPIVQTPGPEPSPTSISITQSFVPAPGDSAPSSSAPPSQTSATPAFSATTPATPSASACPANLHGAYQYPHLIIPVDSAHPTTAYGSSYNGTITPTVSTIINFDIPASYAGMTCSLVFLFPEQAALQASGFTFNAQGGISVSELSTPAAAQTTFDTVPAAAVPDVGAVGSVQSGNSYVLTSHACGAGLVAAFEVSSTGGLALDFFQDSGPAPIGFYVTAC